MSALSFTRETFIAALLIVLLFASGIAAGFALARALPASPAMPTMHPPPPHHSPTEYVVQTLGLDDTQAKAVKKAFETARQKAEATHKKLKPELDAIFEAAKTEVKTVLTDEQKERFEQMALTPRPPPPGRGGPPPHGGPPPGPPPPHGGPPPHGPPPHGAPPPPR